MGLHGRRQRSVRERIRELSLRAFFSLLSGVFLAAAFPPLNAWPLGVLACSLLFLAVWGGNERCTSRGAFWLGFLQGVASFGLSLHWLGRLFSFGAPVLVAIAAFFPALFCLLAYESHGPIERPLARALLAATIWTGVEFYRSELFPLRFSWITPGLALGPTSITPILGVYGGSFLVVFACALVSVKRQRLFGSACLVCLLLLGALQPRRSNPPKESFRVAAVQREACSLDELIQASRPFAGEKVDLMVWPEYAVPADPRQGYPYHVSRELREVMELSDLLDAPILFGTVTFVQEETFNFRNTALLVSEKGPLGEYHKMRPVHFFDDGIPGRRAKPIPAGGVSVGTPICFDGDFSLISRKMAAEGATFFAVPSCDMRSWGRVQHEQHALQLPMRAAETGRWIVSAASSGPSRIIDAEGCVIEEVGAMDTGQLIGDLEQVRRNTPYVVLGWLFPWICLAGTIFLPALSYGLRRFSVHPIRDQKPGPPDELSATGRDT